MVRSHGKDITILKAGDSFALGGATVELVGPVMDYGGNARREDNHSLVMRISYGEQSFLFTGDIYTQAEYDIMDKGAELGSKVLKVAHHGSSTSSGEAFLQAVNPKYAVISSEGSQKNHPHHETLEKLQRMNIITRRTDMEGDIVFACDKHNMQVMSGQAE
ncbi:hypothetical protein IJT17_08670 [bacterium]|nr:hypothetical protein [bacterium]